MRVFLFPGQGSQRKGMGEALFDQVPQFRDVESQLDQLLGYSLRKLCLEDPENRLKDTRYTQPCLFVVNALHYWKACEGGPPDIVAGHSLGEYNALLAAGCIDLLTGVRLVQKRGELMAQSRNGGMAAIVGLAADDIAGILERDALASIDLANFNSPTQTVLSGPIDDLKKAIPVLEQAGASMCVMLPVSAAFHSRYMRPAAEDFARFLDGFEFGLPRIPVVANVTAAPYPDDPTGGATRSLLVRQMYDSVRWTQTIQYLLASEAQDFHETGPGKVLTQLVQQIRSAWKAPA